MTQAALPKPWEPGAGPEDDIHLSLRDHLMELRKRLKWAALFLVIGFCACYYWSQQIFHFLMRPVLAALPEGEKALHFSSGVEPFLIYLKVALYAGIFVTAPAMFWQVWAFVAPGLYRREKRNIFTRLSSSRSSKINSSVRSEQGSTLKINSHSRSSPAITSLRR